MRSRSSPLGGLARYNRPRKAHVPLLDSLDFLLRIILSTSRAASPISQCSQYRKTSHPSATSNRLVSLSRERFSSSFFRQNASFVLGTCECKEQPCQKQPSMKIAIFNRVKTTSALLLMLVNGLTCTLNRRPARCRSERSSHSFRVFVFPIDCIRRRVRGDDALGRSFLRIMIDSTVPVVQKRSQRHLLRF